MKPTPARLRALRIVRDYVARGGAIRPTEFARLMWPDSPGHRRHTKCGPSGVSVGGGMRLAAGGYLGKLRAAGLIRWGRLSAYDSGPAYVLSEDGRRMLEEHEQRHGAQPEGTD